MKERGLCIQGVGCVVLCCSARICLGFRERNIS